jgi:hypothetical protein
MYRLPPSQLSYFSEVLDIAPRPFPNCPILMRSLYGLFVPFSPCPFFADVAIFLGGTG